MRDGTSQVRHPKFGVLVTEKLVNDAQWASIAPLLGVADHSRKGAGRPRADPRGCFEALLWVSVYRATWKELPRSYGSPVTVWRRLRGWKTAGILDPAVSHYLDSLDASERSRLWGTASAAHLTRHILRIGREASD